LIKATLKLKEVKKQARSSQNAKAWW